MTPARELLTLARAIARREPAAKSLLRASPLLARTAFREGATRQEATAWYLVEIEHYIYAGDTLLHVAAATYDRVMARALVAVRGDVRARNRRGAEPLHYAADGGPTLHTWNPRAQADIIAYLIEAGADPNALDKSGVAPLHRAVRNRCTSAVRALLAGGADPRLENKSGSTPIDLATQTTGRGASGTPEAKREQSNILIALESQLARR
jgi:hypothetical protein